MKSLQEIINGINQETKIQGDRIVKEVNENKDLDTWFKKWCEGNKLFEKRRDEVMAIQSVLRDLGYNVKMNMQNYELSYYGLIDKGVK